MGKDKQTKIKATARKIEAAYNILSGADYKGIDTKEKIALIKLTSKLGNVVEPLRKLRDDAYKRLQPKNFEEIARKMQCGETLTPAENFAYTKFDKDLSECMAEELDKVHEINADLLSADTFTKLIDCNDFKVGQAALLMEVIA